jgi:hypothetical protein
MDVSLKSLSGIPESNIMNIDVTNPSNKLNMMVLMIIVVVLLVYYSFISSLGTATAAAAATVSSQATSTSLNYIELLLWGIFVVLILINGMTYIFDLDVVASIRNIFTSKPVIDIAITDDDIKVQKATSRKQVFHIPDNKYTYEDAKAICKAYDARLATYKDMSEAFDKGADWCGYGWSDGQMALYPTQFEKWQNLQKIPGHQHDCGRPGINGGYMANSKIKYGINCYGYKPKINETEIQDMATKPLYPKTKKEVDFEKKVEKWKEKLPDILISPFNHDNWSII